MSIERNCDARKVLDELKFRIPVEERDQLYNMITNGQFLTNEELSKAAKTGVSYETMTRITRKAEELRNRVEDTSSCERVHTSQYSSKEEIIQLIRDGRGYAAAGLSDKLGQSQEDFNKLAREADRRSAEHNAKIEREIDRRREERLRKME